MKNNKLITFFVPKLTTGGAERQIINIANELVRNKFDIKLVTIVKGSNSSVYLDKNIKIINLECSRVLFSFFKIIKYFFTNKSIVYFSTIRHLNIYLIFCNFLFFFKKNIYIIETSLLDNHIKFKKKYFYYFIFNILTFIFYPFANKIIAPSLESERILKKNYFLSRKVVKIYNPINVQDIISLSNTTNIPKIFDNKNKTIVSIGRLTWEKDYINLIKAFELSLKFKNNLKLIILGDGAEKKFLNEYIDSKNLGNKIFLLGNIDNPYVYFKHSDLYILSSISELLPTALIESLVLQPNIISTDCKYGPAEILQNGKWGTLLPPRNFNLMSKLIIKQINNPLKSESIERAYDFDIKNVIKDYISIIKK